MSMAVCIWRAKRNKFVKDLGSSRRTCPLLLTINRDKKKEGRAKKPGEYEKEKVLFGGDRISANQSIYRKKRLLYLLITIPGNCDGSVSKFWKKRDGFLKNL